MKSPQNVTRSVTTDHILWQPPRFPTTWAHQPDAVPDYDPCRLKMPELPTDSEYEAMHFAAQHKLSEPPPPHVRNYPRLVRSFPKDSGDTAVQSPQIDSRHLLRDLARLDRVLRSDDENRTKTQAAILVFAEQYTPFATYRPHDPNWDGLSLYCWVTIIQEVAVWAEFISLLDERLDLSENAKWIDRKIENTKKKKKANLKNTVDVSAVNARLRHLRHLKRAYFDYVDYVPDQFDAVVDQPAKQQRQAVMAHRQKYKISSNLVLRQRVAADLQNRLGRYSGSLVSIPNHHQTRAKEAYQSKVICEVGVYEWASFLLAQKLRWSSLSHICPTCGRVFEARRRDKVYCSGRCRTAMSRKGLSATVGTDS